MTKMKATKWTLKAILGFVLRLLLAVPIILLLTKSSLFDPTTITNMVFFSVILMGIHSVLLLSISTLVPATYAIKTDISVLEFNLWWAQRSLTYISAGVLFVLSFLLSGLAMYWFAGILFVYALSYTVWPYYIKRIDLASKQDLIDKLASAGA